MSNSKKIIRASKSALSGQFSNKHPKGDGTLNRSVTKEKAIQVERSVREFYSRHGEAMTTLAYE